MRSPALLLIISALLASLCDGLSAASTNRSNRAGYSDFRIISDRNIFNPNRSARSSNQSERRDTRRTNRTDYVTLLGTMSYQKGPLAFFEGSRSDFKKVIQPGDKIAEFGVAAIEDNRVMLNAGTNWLELAVGKQLRREDDGEWRITDAPERQITSYSSSSTSSSTFTRPAYPSVSTSISNQPAMLFPPPGPGPDGSTPVVMVGPDGAVAIMPPPDGSQTNGTPQVSPPGGPNDVLQRLIQRREEELNR